MSKMSGYGMLLVLWLSSFGFALGEEWPDGVVILNDDQVLTGETRYNSTYDLIQIKIDTRIHTYNPRQVRKFTFYDHSLKCPRNFISITLSGKYGARDCFFEVVNDGYVKVLRKRWTDVSPPQKQFEDRYEVNGNVMPGHKVSEALQYNYYFAYENRLFDERSFREDLYHHLLHQYSVQLAQFVKDQHLNLHKLRDQILTIRFFNENVDHSLLSMALTFY